MSDTPQPWLGEVAPQPNAQIHAPADMGRLLTNPARPAVPKRRYCKMVIPESVEPDLTEAERTFGIWLPTAVEVKRWAKRGTVDVHDEVQNYVAMIGGVEGVDSTQVVRPWWARLGGKAQTMIVNEFAGLFTPTVEEGESLRASKQWVG